MAKRPDQRGGSAGQRRPGRPTKDARGLTVRQVRPKQISARVDDVVFQRLGVLRRVLGLETGEIISRALDLLIRDLPAPRRRMFDLLMSSDER